MSIKELMKTRWTVESDRITIYPYGWYFVVSVILAVLLIGFTIAVYIMEPYSFAHTMTILTPFFVAFLALFFANGYTHIVFDNTSFTMTKKWLGIIPVVTKSFDQLHGINVMRQSTGGFNFRMYPKDNKFGKGIALSSYYTKDSHPNCVAFTSEVIPLIHKYLDMSSPLTEQKEIITEYQYFTESNGIYTYKQRRVGMIIFAIACLALGIHEMTPYAYFQDKNDLVRFLFIVGPLLFALIFLNAMFMTITFDTKNRMVEKKSPARLGNLKMPFEYFQNFHMIRKTTNGAYSGTEVHMIFHEPGAKNTKSMMIRQVQNTRKIDRLIDEIKSIMR
ncbi:hypothetical protein [Chitinophaga silvisoli]|uniref:Uncharacterized protein n=1 Tax=Chitinophaga silvisoli TaxID=2291814 RepID=A0A3E1NVW0_9BACT|nr:hypothetical protein [Chitinophaga silvisoli]RFM32037.1 hypothetical protein DXN04_24945 [Chitinophaga silvisoli]